MLCYTTRTLLLLLLTYGLLTAGGCGHLVRLHEDPVAMTVIGPVEVDVQSFNGDVFITADEFGDTATVRVVRASVHGFGRFREGEASLPQIRYSARVVAGEIGPRLQVRTFTDHPESHYQRAHLHITVPAVEGVYVRTTNGRVYATGIAGPVDIQTTNGDVRVMTNQPMRQSVTIVNHRGNIDYRVRAESTGLIDSETVRGRIVNRIRRGQLVINSGTNERRLHAQLNKGENPVTLRTVDGDIRIAVVRNPEQVGSFIFE